MNQIREIQWAEYGDTLINPLALVLTIVLCIMIIVAKKEYIILPLIIVSCFITTRQNIAIFGLNFSMARIVLLFGYARFFIKHDLRSMKFNSIDKLMICYFLVKLIAHSLLWKTSAAFIEIAGGSMDTILVYFLIRFFLYDLSDFNILFKALIIMSILVAIFMVNEHITNRNIFYIFGGVNEIAWIRDGKLRAQGAFAHPIMAGSFGAFLLPIAHSLWHKNFKKYAILGYFTSLIITFTSSSSGPLAAYLAGIFGIFMWKFRNKMKTIVWGSIILLIILHFIMNAPVWYLIQRIDFTGSSTSHHRAALIDAAVRNFSDWFLIGIQNTAYWGWGLQDTTNQYILEGQLGGFFEFLLFILIIRKCFKTIRSSMESLNYNINTQKFVWAIGVILFVHTVSFMGVSYFGQMEFFYYFTLAAISSLNNFPEIVNKSENNDEGNNSTLEIV